MTQGSPWQSIQLKLTALMGGLLLLVVGALTVLFYRGLERSLEVSAQARLEGAATVLSDALRPQLAGRAEVIGRLAALPEVAALAADPVAGRAAAEAAIRIANPPPTAPTTRVTLELRGADGSCVGTMRRGPDVFTPGGCLDLGPITVAGPEPLPIRAPSDTARLAVAAPVPGAAGPIGYLIERRPFNQAAAGLKLIEGLIGTNARLYLANADGSLWTDLTQVVPAPYPQPPKGLIRYQIDGHERIALGSPVAGTPLAVSVEFPRDAVLAPAGTFLRRAFLATLVLVLLGCVGVWTATRRFVAPLRDATRVAELAAAGNLGTRIAVGRPDEIGRFAAAFNTMAEEVERSHHELEGRVERRTQQLKETLRQLRGAQDELVRKEKLATLGQLSSSVGHELRNPLGVMSNAVYFLKLVLKDAPPKVAEYLGILKHQIVLSEKIVSDLLDFARVKAPQTESVAVAELVRAQLERVGDAEGVEVVTSLTEGLPLVFVDRVQVGQVLFNLFTNAVQAMEAGGTLRVSAVRGAHGTVRVHVTDTGTGITPENLQLIFDPLFTTKARGIGLGLSVARMLARANRGDIEVSSEVGRGSTFTLTLPSAAEAAA